MPKSSRQLLTGALTSRTPLRVCLAVALLFLTPSIQIYAQTVTRLTDPEAPLSKRLSIASETAVDSTGNIYVTDRIGNAVFRITTEAEPEQILDLQSAPIDIAIDSNDIVYILHSGFITLYSPTDGDVQSQLFRNSTSNFWKFIEVDNDNNLIVAGEYVRPNEVELWKFTPDATAIEIDIPDSLTDESSAIKDLLTAPNGDIYLSAGNSVYLIDRNNQVIEVMDASGDGVRPITGVHALAIDSMGRPYASSENGIFRLATFGNVEFVTETPNVLADMRIDAQGNITGLQAGVGVFNSEKVLTELVHIDESGYLSGLNPFQATDKISNHGIANFNTSFADNSSDDIIFGFGRLGVVRLDDNLNVELVTGVLPGFTNSASIFSDVTSDLLGRGYYATGGYGSLNRVSAHLQTTEIISDYGAADEQVLDARHIALDPAGNSYLTDFEGQRIFVHRQDGRVELLVDANTPGIVGPFAPGVLAFSAIDNALYIADEVANRVYRVDTNGAVSIALDATEPGVPALDLPTALSVDGQGNVLVVGNESDNVLRLSRDSSVTELINASGDGDHALQQPSAATTAPDGTVYVTGSGSNNVFAISPQGLIEQVLDSSGDGAHQLLGPRDVVCDAYGNIFVIARESHNAFALTPDGQIIMFFDLVDHIDRERSSTRLLDLSIDARGTLFLLGHDGNPFGGADVFRVDYPEQIASAFSPYSNELVASVELEPGIPVDVLLRYRPDLSSGTPIFEFVYGQSQPFPPARPGVVTQQGQALVLPEIYVVDDRVYSNAVFQVVSTEPPLLQLVELSE